MIDAYLQSLTPEWDPIILYPCLVKLLRSWSVTISYNYKIKSDL